MSGMSHMKGRERYTGKRVISLPEANRRSPMLQKNYLTIELVDKPASEFGEVVAGISLGMHEPDFDRLC